MNGIINAIAARDGDKLWWEVCAHSGVLERTDMNEVFSMAMFDAGHATP